MNWLDIAFIAVLLFSVLGGLVRGFVREVFGLIGLIAGFLLAMFLASTAANQLERWMPHAVGYAVGFVAIFFIVAILAALGGNILTRAMESLQLSCLNRLAGGAFGLVRGAVMIIVLFWGLLFLVQRPDQLMAGSRLAPIVYKGAQWLEQVLPGHPSPEQNQVI